MPEVNANNEIAIVKAALAGRNGIGLQIIYNPNIKKFKDIVLAYRPHLLHFVGHAQFNPKNENFTPYTSKGIPLGVDIDHTYNNMTAKLIHGSIGILYSDGLISAINSNGDSFSLEKIKSIVIENSESTPAVITRTIYNEFSRFIDRDRLTNDASLIIFKV